MAEDTQNMDTADTLQDVSIEEALARLDEIAARLRILIRGSRSPWSFILRASSS